MSDALELRGPVRKDDEAEMLTAIDGGIEQLDRGEGVPLEEVQQKMREWLSE